MFWGLIMEPQKKYTQTVKKAFHISMAALDNDTATDEYVQVMCGYDNRKYLLCTLHKDKVMQCALDLSFDIGTEVSFITNGHSHVHLSGYLIQDEDMFDDLEEEEEECEQEEADVSVGNVSASNIVSGKRSKPGKAEGQPPTKKLKTMDLLQDIDDGEDDEDDSDVDINDLLEESDDEDDTGVDEADLDDDEDEDDEDEDGEEEEDDEEEGEEEESDDEEEESDDEEDEVFDMPPQNGTAKKGKKAQLAEQKKAAQQEKSPKADKKSAAQQAKSPTKRVAEGGVQIEDIRVGSGAPAKAGRMVSVFYEGRFKSGKIFDSSTKGNGFKFRLGRGEVIKGWDVGVSGMKVGGKRRIVCPPAMAYGAKGSPPTIPPNSTLTFEVELRNVN
ncbi:46 kDa FK506-binding nuclear protein isoform X2 [Atheta coriaria]|uniref:46 kDa FK506-binding nuclear protein isoform X2 n=1 Tax=Dalotia coriaria TaxID=877792 RepID=UPI0031F400D3